MHDARLWYACVCVRALHLLSCRAALLLLVWPGSDVSMLLQWSPTDWVDRSFHDSAQHARAAPRRAQVGQPRRRAPNENLLFMPVHLCSRREPHTSTIRRQHGKNRTLCKHPERSLDLCAVTFCPFSLLHSSHAPECDDAHLVRPTLLARRSPRAMYAMQSGMLRSLLWTLAAYTSRRAGGASFSPP